MTTPEPRPWRGGISPKKADGACRVRTWTTAGPATSVAWITAWE